MPPPTQADLDALQAQLQKRLLESGEWDRIKFILASKLNESGWTDDMRSRSKERARSMEALSFAKLWEELTSHAQSSVSLAVRKEVVALIRGYLEKQFE
ncbi:transcription factor e(y)2-domain-containing protein [Mycena sp. CBHHK59/15]|nr:transcription factor e(y)2-domain-containing protein [Mycena sp. CBHHK59/15]